MISTRHSTQTDGLILLRPKPTKWLLVALGSLAFVLIGIWMVRSRDMFGWLAIVFFGLCLAVSLICLLPKASYLRLTPDGFTMCSLFRAHTIRWEDVRGFGVVSAHSKVEVVQHRAHRIRSWHTGLIWAQA